MKAKEYTEKYIRMLQQGKVVSEEDLSRIVAQDLYEELKSSTNPRMSRSHIMSIIDSFMLKGLSVARKINHLYPNLLKEKFFYYWLADKHEDLFKEWSNVRSDTLSNMNMYRINPVKSVNPKGFDEVRESLSRKSKLSNNTRPSDKSSSYRKGKPQSKSPIQSQSISAVKDNLTLYYKDPDQAAEEQEHKDFWDLFNQAHPKAQAKEVSSND